jgi:hypothetical protein
MGFAAVVSNGLLTFWCPMYDALLALSCECGGLCVMLVWKPPWQLNPYVNALKVKYESPFYGMKCKLP